MDLNNLLIFSRVAETRSFTAASEQLNLSPSAASKGVSRLETDLGVLLLHRTTRSVTLTVEGAALLDRCREIFADIDEMISAIRGLPGRPSGRFKAVLPVALGERILVPALRKLALMHPEIVFDLELTDRIPDILYEGLDCAIQLDQVTDERVVARKLGDLRFHPCASPEYLERHGEPETPDDLDRHDCLAVLVPKTARYREWQFEKDGKVLTKNLSGRINVNSGSATLQAVLAGEGIGMLGSYTIEDAVRSGHIKVLLKSYAIKGPGVWLLYPERRNVSPKLRLFIDFVAKLFEAPSWDKDMG